MTEICKCAIVFTGSPAGVEPVIWAILENEDPMRRRTKSKKREFNVIIEKDSEGFYVATVPELRGCHSQAKSLDTLMTRVREAIDLCLEAHAEDSGSPEFIGVQRIAV